MTAIVIFAAIVSCAGLALVVAIVASRLLVKVASAYLPVPTAFDLPSRLVGERICSAEDWELVAREAPGFRKQFQRNRKLLMLLWLRNVRGAVVDEVRQYRVFVRTQAAVSPLLEYRLAMDYFGFLMLCGMVEGLILVSNPVRLRAAMDRLRAAASELSFVASQRRLAPEGIR